MVKRLSTMQETWVQSLGWEDSLEKEMANHSSTLAWKIPWMEEPGRLQDRKESDTTERLHFHFTYLIGKLILKGHFPGGSDGKKAACNEGVPGLIPGLGRSSGEGKGYLLQYSGLDHPWGRKELDTTEQLSLSYF